MSVYISEAGAPPSFSWSSQEEMTKMGVRAKEAAGTGVALAGQGNRKEVCFPFLAFFSLHSAFCL
jgi:hypothetical protein